jgi:outer membrane translocation and assembly module TamA
MGLARGFQDGVVPATERFFAGGATTLRGFAQNSVGPISDEGQALGGTAMFVVNNEIRFPPIGPFDGAAFVDIGNVWERVGAISFSSLRWSGGVGAACADALDPGPGRRRRSLRSPAR